MPRLLLAVLLLVGVGCTALRRDPVQEAPVVHSRQTQEDQDVAVHNRNDVNIKFPHRNPYIKYSDAWEDPFLQKSFSAKEAQAEEALLKQQLEAVPFGVAPDSHQPDLTVDVATSEKQELKDIAKAEHVSPKRVQMDMEGMAFGQPTPDEMIKMQFQPQKKAAPLEPDTIKLRNNNVVWHRG